MEKVWVPISQVLPIRWVLLHFFVLWEIDGKTHAFPIWWDWLIFSCASYSVCLPSLLVFTSLWSFLSCTQVLQKPCQGNFEKFQESRQSRFGGSEKDRYFLKILKWQHKLVRDYKRGMLVSYFLNNTAKTCLYGLKNSKNIDIEHMFQSKAFFRLSSNLHTSSLSVFNRIEDEYIHCDRSLVINGRF